MAIEKIELTNEDDDITLFTDDEHVTVKKVNYEFHQASNLKGVVREFTIFNDIHCYQYEKKKYVRKIRFRVNLTYLDPKPVRKFVLADSWLFITAISAIVSFMVVYMGWFSAMNLPVSLVYTAASISVSFSLIALMITLLRTQDQIFIVSRFGRIPVLELINKNPSKSSYNEFMSQLGKHIISAQHKAHLNATDHLTMELKELRRLKNEMVINENYYEQAKKRIFKNKAFKSETKAESP